MREINEAFDKVTLTAACKKCGALVTLKLDRPNRYVTGLIPANERAGCGACGSVVIFTETQVT